MSNMSYCRFRNTYGDLRVCYSNWDTLDEDDEEEQEARAKLLELCRDIVNDYCEEEE